jgi:hypothetical protein
MPGVLANCRQNGIWSEIDRKRKGENGRVFIDDLMVGLGGLEPPTSPLSVQRCLVLQCGGDESVTRGSDRDDNGLTRQAKLSQLSGYSGEGEHRFRREAERHSGAKVNSSRSEATLAW